MNRKKLDIWGWWKENRAWLRLFVLSAAIDTLNQLRITPIDFEQSRKKYQTIGRLPEWLFEWDFGWIVDAFHQYQGWALFLIAVSFALHEKNGHRRRIFESYGIQENGLMYFCYYGAMLLIWYQIRNQFLHKFFATM